MPQINVSNTTHQDLQRLAQRTHTDMEGVIRSLLTVVAQAV